MRARVCARTAPLPGSRNHALRGVRGRAGSRRSRGRRRERLGSELLGRIPCCWSRPREQCVLLAAPPYESQRVGARGGGAFERLHASAEAHAAAQRTNAMQNCDIMKVH